MNAIAEQNLQALAERWFPGQKWSMTACEGGMNNTTRFVETGGNKYVLRIYETHRDRAKIAYEHKVLLALSGLKLPFRTPVPVSLPSGGTIAETNSASGKLAALFSYTEGTNPYGMSPAQIGRVGEAVGQLSNALQRLNIASAPAYRPYYEIEDIHPRCTPEAISQFCRMPPDFFLPLQTALLYIEKRFEAFFERIADLKRLPHQLVHGDINGSNMLVDAEGRIAAILDFEFVTRDLRVMELAVCLSDLIDPAIPEAEMWGNIEALLSGYRRYAALEEEEVQALPLLVELRRLDVFVHFLGRFLDGVDGREVLAGIVRSTWEKTKWLEQHGARVTEI